MPESAFLSAMSRVHFNITEVVSGGARGVDSYGEAWAKARGIAIKRFPADWSTHGKKAGFLRNVQMAEYADVLVAVWDGKSRGTRHMISAALRRKLKVKVFILEEPCVT